MTTVDHSWLPTTSCRASCVEAGLGRPSHRILEVVRIARRIAFAPLFLLTMPLLRLPIPGRSNIQRAFCRTLLGCLGVRVAVSGAPIRRLQGVLVVSNHLSWVDVVAIGAVLPGTFVARADLIEWPGVGLAARVAGVIPIERRSLRGLPLVVDDVFRRLNGGNTVVAFPEGTTYCGRDHGQFRPALFQAAIDAARPVQPMRLSYAHRDGSHSTVTAFLGEDSLWASLKRTVRVKRTIAHVEVFPLQSPGAARRELATRCEALVLSRNVRATAAIWPPSSAPS